MAVYYVALTWSLSLLAFKGIWTSSATVRKFTSHCHFLTVQRALVKFMWVVCSPELTILFVYIT
jgi:hypothetical protein